MRQSVPASIAMIALSGFAILVQTAYSGTWATHANDNYLSFWALASLVMCFTAPFILLARERAPYLIAAIAFAATAVLAFGPALALVALASAVARRKLSPRLIACITAGTLATLISCLRDASMPQGSSVIKDVLAPPGQSAQEAAPIDVSWWVPLLITLFFSAIAVGSGMLVRSRAITAQAGRTVAAAQSKVSDLHADLAAQQQRDAIAREAHDTLAHSLSLIGISASGLSATATSLVRSAPAGASTVEVPTARLIDFSQRAEVVRRQAAGALDEAHTIIGMLRNPETIPAGLAADEGTALTREALTALIDETRRSGTRLDTWIDVEGLSGLDPAVGKVAYRTLQEALTNARRHAQGQPVALDVRASPRIGISLIVSNPVPVPEPAGGHRHGQGLRGMSERVSAVSGRASWGVRDSRFWVRVQIPWRPRPARR